MFDVPAPTPPFGTPMESARVANTPSEKLIRSDPDGDWDSCAHIFRFPLTNNEYSKSAGLALMRSGTRHLQHNTGLKLGVPSAGIMLPVPGCPAVPR